MPHRANGSYVSHSDALTAWTSIAIERLRETARTYRAVLTADDLAAAVQEESGIAGEQPVSAWIGKLLERVDAEAARRDEPPLAALCLSDGDDALRAERRLRCYREYSLDLPAGGGEAEVHRRVAIPRPARQRSAAAPRTRAVTPSLREVTCSSCFLIVPAGPVCSSCGSTLEA